MNTLVFDIETVPDVAFGRRLYGLGALADAQVAKAMFALRRQDRGADFLPLEQHRVVAISCALRNGDGFTLWSVGEATSGEGELVQRFFDGIDEVLPGPRVLERLRLRSAGAELPCAPLRGAGGAFLGDGRGRNRVPLQQLSAAATTGGIPTSWTCCRASAPATGRRSPDMACLLRLPGKLGFSGEQVWDAYQRGDLGGIRRYCETDVLNTYLIYLRFEQLRGRLTGAAYREEVERVRAFLSAAREPHLQQFLAAWDRGRVSAAVPGAPAEEVALVAGLTHEGEGVVRGGKTAFVPGALPGERIRLRRRRRHARHDDGELLEVLTPSAERVAPRCAHFGVCGGCVLQHLAPAAQLAAKESELRTTLERVARVAPRRWLEPLTGPVWAYRRRARLGAKFVYRKDRVVVGFRERAAPYVARSRALRGAGQPRRAH